MNYIAIDPGSKTGWATSLGGFGMCDIRPLKPKAATKRRPAIPGEPDDERFIKLWALLDQLALKETRWTLIHEGPLPHQASQRAAKLAYGTWAALALWARTRNVPRIEVSPLDLQRFALGRKATSGGSEMLEAAQRRLGYTDTDEDIADALWLLRFAQDRARLEGGKPE